ncbi:Fc.00g082140.m01.CDS01 [Cosmosporella sp. VM-42]
MGSKAPHKLISGSGPRGRLLTLATLVNLLWTLANLLWTLDPLPWGHISLPSTLPFLPSIQLSLPTTPTGRNTSELYCFEASLPNITIIAAGGTILGWAPSPDRTTGYQSGVLDVETLLQSVPHVCERANIRVVHLFSKDSTDLDSSETIKLSQTTGEELKRWDVAGVVVITGTSTMPETAFFVDATNDSWKPTVFVGAVRPFSTYSYDGAMNLLNAVDLATREDAWYRGVMIALDGQIASTWQTEKDDTTSLNAFGPGDLGIFVDGEVIFYSNPTRGLELFDISELPPSAGLPKVEVHYGQPEYDPSSFMDSIGRGVKGFVLVSTDGYWPTHAADEMQKRTNGTDIVTGMSQLARGYVRKSPMDFDFGSGLLNPAKSRILLQLCLAKGLDKMAIKAVFEGPTAWGRARPPTTLSPSNRDHSHCYWH